MTVESETRALAFSEDGADAILDLNLYYIRQIGASLRKHVGIQDKLEREIKLRDGASRMLGACTHEDQLLEVAKTLHTSNARMYTYMAELQKLKTAEIMEKAMDEEGIQNELKVCSGRVAISDIRIPLIWNDPERYAGAKVKEASRYAVFCLVRVGSEVQDTELVCTDKTTTDVSFRDVLVFENAEHNFKMDVEIFAFPMSEESISAPTTQKLLSRLNRSIGKSEGKRIRDRLKDSPASNMKTGPQYEKLGCLTLDLSCVDDHIRSHDITRTIAPYCTTPRTRPLLPLYESLTCRVVAQPRCITEKSMTGFLHCMELDHGMPCWSYMWCEVRAGKLKCWMNPEDSAEKAAQNSINLIGRDIKINEIEKNRQKRPNSFQVRDLTDRHIFSASSKEDMTKWIKNLRQHRSDYAAWSIACAPDKNGLQPLPMFIASPATYKSPSHLFDASVRKTLIYDQMSIESPNRPDCDAIEVSDMLKTCSSPQPVGVAMIEANQPTPWAGLFSGALNKSATKVTKLKDVQNIETQPMKKSSRPRSKSCETKLSSSSKPLKQKKEHKKPPLPRRPSNEIIDEKKSNVIKSPDAVKHFPKIECLKSCNTSESCSETALSDFCQSSDDVFLSSDENILDSSSKKKKSSQLALLTKSKGRKKRRAPQPPTNRDGSLPDTYHTMGTRSRSKASLSSASSLDDILENGQDHRKSSHPTISYSHPVPQPSPRIFRSNGVYVQDSDPEGRNSQLSLASNSTQVSNTSSGYKSDSEGLLTVSVTSLSNDKLGFKQSDCEVLVTEREVKLNRKGLTGVKVLPTNLSTGAKRTPYEYSRSHSWDSEDILCSDNRSENHSNDESSRLRFCSTPPSVPRGFPGRPPPLPKPNSASKVTYKSNTQVVPSYKTVETPTGIRPPIPRPIPAPRRSYLAAVESNKIRSKPTLLRDIPDSPYSEIDIPCPSLAKNPEDIYAVPTPRALRSTNNNNASDLQEPIYATVDKSKKKNRVEGKKFETPRKIGVDAYTKAHKAIITVCKQRMEEEHLKRSKSISEDETVYV